MGNGAEGMACLEDSLEQSSVKAGSLAHQGNLLPTEDVQRVTSQALTD